MAESSELLAVFFGTNSATGLQRQKIQKIAETLHNVTKWIQMVPNTSNTDENTTFLHLYSIISCLKPTDYDYEHL